MNEGCLGQIPENVDGDAPHTQRGCDAQAWGAMTQGLAGASAVCRRLPPTINVINLDGLDDGGRFQVIDRHGIPPRGLAPHLVAALLGAAHQLGLPAERRTLPIGVLADHVPFVEAGMAAVTVMRGTWESLTRVHLPGDNTSRLSADGVVHTTSLVSAALALLREKGVA